MPRVLRSLSSQRPLRRGEERILALIHHLRTIRDSLEAKKSAEASAGEAQRRITELEAELARLEAGGTPQKATFGEMFMRSRSHFIAIGAAASLGIGVAIGSGPNKDSPAPLFYLIGIGGGIAAALRTKQQRNTFNEKVEAQNHAISAARQAVGAARKQYSEYARQAKNNAAEIPKITLGTAFVPLESKPILGQNLIIDPTGLLVEPSLLRAIALRDLSSDAERILRMTQQLEEIPVLLAPNPESIAESRQSNAALHGEERELKEAVRSYVATLGSISDEELTIHAVKPTSPLGQAIVEVLKANECMSKDISDSDLTPLASGRNEAIDNEIARFETLQRETESISSTALPQLDQINSGLKSLCRRYSSARKESTNILHSNYYKILSRANWCSKKFYCPRTILSRSYLQALVGLDMDVAHTLEFNKLIDLLNADSFISSRLRNKPQILDELSNSHRALTEIMHSYQLVPDENGIVRAGSAADYIVDQYNQELALFRQRLIEALTGSPNGFLGISESARLYYDPSRELWSSPVLPYSYTTAEVEQYGQVLRTDVDLLIPLWEHLWTEKSDFRKSELFRTNESIQRMSEKEGEKIKQIGYQFQADLREVRSNMFLAKADFDAKLQELEEYEEGVIELGVMDATQLQRLQSATTQLEAVRQETVGDAGGYERILMLEPKNQLLRRQSKVHDPIDVIKSPDLLIEGGRDAGIRRLVHADATEATA